MTFITKIKYIMITLSLLGIISAQNFGCTAYKIFLPVEEGPSTFCSELVQRSQEYIWERRYFEALDLLDEAARQCEDSTEICLMRGDIFYTLENWQEARNEFETVLDQEPRNHQAVVCLWFMDAIEKGFDEAAKEELKNNALEYLEEDPEDPEVVYTAVLGLEGVRAAHEKTKVIESYIHIVKDPSWRGDLAELYFYDTISAMNENLTERARFFKREFPQHRFRYNMAGMVLSSLIPNGPEAVRSAVREILKGERKNRVLNYLCAKALLDVGGDLDLAEKYIRRAIKAAKNPDPIDRYKYVDNKTWDKIMDNVRAEYQAVYGRIIFLQGHKKEALKQFNKGLSQDVRSHNLHLWYAEILEQEDHLDEALRHYRKAAELASSEEAANGIQRLLSSEQVDVDPAEYFAEIERIPRFTDMTDEAGLRDCTGKRVAWSDINGDGFPDLVITGRNIFSNNGDGTFSDVTDQCGINHEYASGGVLADFDNNGLPDLMAFTSRNGPRLYLNRTEQGSPVMMEDVTEFSLPAWPCDGGPTEAAAVADVDGDGAVDIYLANFEKPGPERAMCASDKFYQNQGDGTFTDATSHIIYSSHENMCGRGASFSDFNGDGRQDLFVANYRLDPDFLLVNSPKDKTMDFKLVDKADEFRVRGLNVLGAYGHSIGGAWGYLEEDYPALFVASLAHPRLLGLSDTSALYFWSAEDERFDSHFEDLGFVYRETHSDPSFVDVDLDGDLDLFITCIYQGAPSFLYLNQDGKFSDVTWLAGVRVNNGWGAAWADYDKDGDMDLLVCSDNAPKLFRNEAQRFKRSWLEVRATGTQSSRTGIGTKVTVQAIDGEGTWVREISAGRGTGNQDEAVAHFGLGNNKAPFKLTVNFPSGAEVVLDKVGCCQMIEVVEPGQPKTDD